jgi:hypothetical protein
VAILIQKVLCCVLTFSVAEALVKQLLVAWCLYTEKRDHFQKLSEIYSENVPEWFMMDKTMKLGKKGEINSVYRHSSSKGE